MEMANAFIRKVKQAVLQSKNGRARSRLSSCAVLLSAILNVFGYPKRVENIYDASMD